ncbi:MAG: class I SAM-dependent methyltransferase [Synechococcales cyanobacterium RM1_1_8]|nr:class I SAM-dependent methyltransferase [Synechococcales cyanobacterium RM1_1_8]
MLLDQTQRSKLDSSSDRLFYDVPRFVTHVDEGFIDQLIQLYGDRLPPQGRILDLMSSWVSHLPPEIHFSHVEGHGMNAEELARNPRLDHYFVQNLNEQPRLPLESDSFDAVINTVSVQYLQQPELVFAEVRRILKPGGIAIFSFSNRMFYQKAIAAWRDGSEGDRVALVQQYFAHTPGFSKPEVIIKTAANSIWQHLGLAGGDPFYAVLAQAV